MLMGINMMDNEKMMKNMGGAFFMKLIGIKVINTGITER